jgi:TetR/AcrR family transcriptional regulator
LENTNLSAEEKIIEAAQKVFLLRGLDGARMQDIANEAGINKALLHYYFRSKEKLFEKIFDQMSSKIVPDLTAIVESNDLSTYEKIELIVDKYIDFVANNPQLPLFLINELNRDKERIKSLLSQTNNFSKMQQFGFQMMMEMQAGKLKTFNPMHLLLNIIAMCVFPFIAKPMIQAVMQVPDDSMDIILRQRKQEVKNFLKEALKS